MGRVELLFLGTGTSAGIPMIGCHCGVCTSTDPRDKRTRTSAVVSYLGKHVLIDTGPELRLQCVANGIDWIDAAVFTHSHADHIVGLDDLRRFNAIRRGPLDVWADAATHDVLSRCFGYAFRKPDPASALFRPHLVPRVIDPATPFDLAGVPWRPVPLLHGDMPVLGFRIGDLAYCTDVSRIPDTSMEMLQGVQTLVLDALQWQKHTTHFSIEEAIAAAGQIGAKQTWFTHIAHACGHAATNAQLPPGIRLAHDGLRVEASL